MINCFVIYLRQSIWRGICIGILLEVGDKFAGPFVSLFDIGNSLDELFFDTSFVIFKRIVAGRIAVDASANAFCSVTIWTGKLGIKADLVDLRTKFITKKIIQ